MNHCEPRYYWSKGWQDAASHCARYARTEWTPEQRAAYDAGYNAGLNWTEQPAPIKPYGWRPKNTPQPTRW